VRPGFGGAKEFQQDGAISSQIKGTILINYGLGTLKRLKTGSQFTSFQHMGVESEGETLSFTSEYIDHRELKVQLTLTTERDLITDIPAQRKSRSTNKYTIKSIYNK
jgi:hypothetical protein